MFSEVSVVRVLITLLFTSTWFLAALGKLSTLSVPEWFLKQFETSFIAKFPGTAIAYWTIAVFEALAFVLCAISLFRCEFQLSADPLFLKWALACSMQIFLMLGFGQRLTSDFVGAASSFQYFIGTLVCYVIIELIPKSV